MKLIDGHKQGCNCDGCDWINRPDLSAAGIVAICIAIAVPTWIFIICEVLKFFS